MTRCASKSSGLPALHRSATESPHLQDPIRSSQTTLLAGEYSNAHVSCSLSPPFSHSFSLYFYFYTFFFKKKTFERLLYSNSQVVLHQATDHSLGLRAAVRHQGRVQVLHLVS